MVNKTNDKDHSQGWDYMPEELSDLTRRVKA